ncbi:MAG: hypothetical protein QOH90_1, partial [Actinomycetota bacterium]|nr:hypothetical protein [Actinomycetota bacterium]
GTEVSYNTPHLPGCEFDIQWDGWAPGQTLNYTFSSQSPTLGGVFIDNNVTMDGNGHFITHVSFNAGTLAGVTPQPNQNYHITLVGDTVGSSTKSKTFWIERACGGLPPPVDLCPNIAGDQAVIPPGLIVDNNGDCVPPDVCPNIDGAQADVPAGMIVDSDGNCVPPFDACPNIDGVQDNVPAGMITDDAGNCVVPPDVCPNLPGAQGTLPTGYTLDVNGDCQPPVPTDLCPNIDGAQATVPAGLEVDDAGNCVEPPQATDDCPNLSGNQVDLPDGYVFNDQGFCVKPEDEVLGKTHFNAKPDKKPVVKPQDAKPDKRKVLPFTGSEPAPWVALGSLLLMSGLGFLYLNRKSDALDIL